MAFDPCTAGMTPSSSPSLSTLYLGREINSQLIKIRLENSLCELVNSSQVAVQFVTAGSAAAVSCNSMSQKEPLLREQELGNDNTLLSLYWKERFQGLKSALAYYWLNPFISQCIHCNLLWFFSISRVMVLLAGMALVGTVLIQASTMVLKMEWWLLPFCLLHYLYLYYR